MVVRHTVLLTSDPRPMRTAFTFPDHLDLEVARREGRLLLRDELEALGLAAERDVASVTEEIDRGFRRR